jgi:hypothetical protein
VTNKLVCVLLRRSWLEQSLWESQSIRHDAEVHEDEDELAA